MKFGGFQKTSLIDFPGKISSILFTTGCNLRCPYCYNKRLVVEPKSPFLLEEDALKILESRKKYVDAVVITGGEPTISKHLPAFIKKLKEKKFSVKLDTNGFFPQILEKCLPYLDYVAMDVKTSLEKYKLLGADRMNGFLQSIELLKKGRVDYEFRNTVVPDLVNEDDIPKMGEIVKCAKRFIFQEFVTGETLDEQYNKLKPYSHKVIAHLAEIMKNYVDEVILKI